MSVGIIVKKYEHWNRSFPNWDSPRGKWIGSKKQYEEEMQKGGFIPFTEVKPKISKWIPSADLQKTLYEVKNMADKNGKIKPTEKLVKKMKDMGISFNPRFMPGDK